MKKIICVANNKEFLDAGDYSAQINSYDVVVRFGKCRNLGGSAGRKTNLLFLQRDRSVIDPAQHREKELEIIRAERPVIVLLQWKWTPEELTDWINSHSIFEVCPLMVMDIRYRLRAKGELAKHNSALPHQPSSGVWAFQFIRDLMPAYQIHLLGFAHTGTDFHDWNAEAKYVESLCKTESVVRL
jgi:hypothetical protein